MRLVALFFICLAPALMSPLRAVGQVVEFGLIVCQQKEFTAPVAVLASIQSSELLIPVTLDLPTDLPPHEGRPCAELLSDLTREGYKLTASTPISKRLPAPEVNFLRRQQPMVERLEWTIQLDSSIAILTCNPLVDKVVRFSDGETPSEFYVPEGASCAVHLSAILALGGEILGRTAVATPTNSFPSGPVTAYTAYELIHRIPQQEQALPRLPRSDNGRAR